MFIEAFNHLKVISRYRTSGRLSIWSISLRGLSVIRIGKAQGRHGGVHLRNWPAWFLRWIWISLVKYLLFILKSTILIWIFEWIPLQNVCNISIAACPSWNRKCIPKRGCYPLMESRAPPNASIFWFDPLDICRNFGLICAARRL